MKVGKPKSKRTPTRLRHKIEKASAAKQRKNRKLAKKNPEWRSRIKKDPGIPNLFPYKDKMLAEMEEGRRRKLEEQQRRREEAKARRTGAAVVEDEAMNTQDVGDEDEDDDALLDYDAADSDDPDAAMADANDTSNPMAALLASARARAADYDDEGMQPRSESDDDGDEDGGADIEAAGAAHTTPQQHSRAVDEIIASSDTLLHVLDARDPLATLSRSLTQRIAADPSKRLLLVLNKIDLVPTAMARAWLAHLSTLFPVLPLIGARAAPGAHTFDHRPAGWTAASTAAALLRALKAQASSRGLRRAAAVGVLGLPNVGKSSVVNALASQLGGPRAACPTGAEAGVTRALRVVKLDGSIKLLDGPGVVNPQHEPDGADERGARLALLAALPPAQIADPTPAVSLLLRRAAADPEAMASLEAHYGLRAMLTDADATTDFLVQVARSRGRLGRGGVPNLHAAGLAVLGDWRDGRIGGLAAPPVAPGAGVGAKGDAAGDRKAIVEQWADEFKIEGLWNDR